MVESALINTLLGSLLGAIAGMVPGSGLLVSLLLVYPYLVSLDLVSLLCFYIGLANLAQYTGSITAIHFGIPGESNSLPAVIEGHALSKQGKSHTAIVGTALASTLSAVISVLFLIAISPFYQSIFSVFYKSINQLIVFVVAICIFVLIGKNNWKDNLLLMLAGFVIGKIGMNDYTGSYFLTFDSLYLSAGVPFFPMIVGLLVFPQLFKRYKFNASTQHVSNIWPSIKLFAKNIHYAIMGTITGVVLGLIPAISTVLSTNISHKIAKKLDRQDPSYRALISAEASNNSAVLMTLMPLLLLGIPITGSEALLVAVMERNLFDLNWTVVRTLGLIPSLLLSVSIATFLGLLVSWPMANILCKFFNSIKKHINLLIFLMLFVCIVFAGWLDSSVVYYVIVFAVFGALGWCLKKYDVLPFIFLFLIQSRLESVAIISYNLYVQ